MYIIIHDPHSSSELPDGAKFRVDIEDEVNIVTDWYVNKLIKGDQTISFPYSRLWCDVERYLIKDPLDDKGRGYAYTRTLDERLLRTIDPTTKYEILAAYKAHHDALENAVEQAISLSPVTIIDAHSFSDYQASFDRPTGLMPDICIGFNHPVKKIVRRLGQFFVHSGYTVGYNYPYSGSLIPDRYIGHPDVTSIMIEVNKRLYLDNVFEPIWGNSDRIEATLRRAVDLIRDDA